MGVYGLISIDVVMRVVGAYALGPLGDKYGRKLVTRISSIGSSLPLVGVALLPGPLLLLLLYAVQGFFTGGLSAGLNVIGLEELPERHRGWFGGSGMAVGGSAYLVASLVFFLISRILGGALYVDLGWRIMFLTSLLIIPFGFLMPESRKFKKNFRRDASPTKSLLTKYRRYFVLAFILTALWSSMNALANSLLPNFLFSVDHLSRTEISQMLTVYSVVLIVSAFLGGELSERLGRRKVFILGGVLGIVLSPVFILLEDPGNFTMLLVSVIGFVTVFGGGGLMAYVNENFPTNIRSTGVSLSWNLGFLVGNLVPLMLVFIISNTSIELFGALETISMIVLGGFIVVASYISHETRGNMESE
ncbi:MFS transporter [Metallosphaera hakonensis]|uniref:MFS transporter n=1 Tax=Metallosphaera hakonensis TaxID=79601 RepID=UPI001F1191BF|nr:MFS transporter [Metallosphaera hakonensis]